MKSKSNIMHFWLMKKQETCVDTKHRNVYTKRPSVSVLSSVCNGLAPKSRKLRLEWLWCHIKLNSKNILNKTPFKCLLNTMNWIFTRAFLHIEQNVKASLNESQGPSAALFAIRHIQLFNVLSRRCSYGGEKCYFFLAQHKHRGDEPVQNVVQSDN